RRRHLKQRPPPYEYPPHPKHAQAKEHFLFLHTALPSWQIVADEVPESLPSDCKSHPAAAELPPAFRRASQKEPTPPGCLPPDADGAARALFYRQPSQCGRLPGNVSPREVLPDQSPRWTPHEVRSRRRDHRLKTPPDAPHLSVLFYFCKAVHFF